MKSKLTTVLLVLGLAVSAGTAGVIASSDGGSSKGADVAQYAPGKGCGDPNKPHSGPPGNPDNTDCPDQAGPKDRTPQSEKLTIKQKCAKKHSKRGRRAICVKRGRALVKCESKEGKAKKKCVTKAKAIGKKQN